MLIAFSLSLFAGVGAELQLLVNRRIYPFILVVFIMTSTFMIQGRQFQSLYEKIKNDKLVAFFVEKEGG